MLGATTTERQAPRSARSVAESRGVLHPRPRPRHHQFARHPVRSRRRIVAVGAARVPADLPAARLGRARPGGDLGDPDRRGRRGAGTRTAAPARHRGHRHHQPARDHGRLGPRDRQADPQRDRLAGPPHRGVLRSPEARRPRGVHPREDRPGDRRLLLGHQARLDSRQRRRAPGPRPRPASWRSAPSTPGWCGSSPAAPRTSPTSPTRRARCSSTSTRCSGTTSC